jgi:hypothetical protein
LISGILKDFHQAHGLSGLHQETDRNGSSGIAAIEAGRYRPATRLTRGSADDGQYNTERKVHNV